MGAMDSLGRSLKDLAVRDVEERKVAEKKIRDLHSLISPQVENNNLEQFVFFVIHTSVFAQTTPEKGQPAMFVPAEIAISKFSLSEGLIATYQAFPVPGRCRWATRGRVWSRARSWRFHSPSYSQLRSVDTIKC